MHKGSSLSPFHTLPNPAAEKLCSTTESRESSGCCKQQFFFGGWRGRAAPHARNCIKSYAKKLGGFSAVHENLVMMQILDARSAGKSGLFSYHNFAQSGRIRTNRKSFSSSYAGSSG